MPREPKIYSIKTVTIRKSERQILQLIKDEFEIVENDIKIWNQMIDEISWLSIDSKSQFCGMISICFCCNVN